MSRSYTLSSKQTALIAALEEAGFDCSWWGRGTDAERVYFKAGRRDVKIFLQFDDAREVEGAALKVFIDDCGQAPAWYASQRNKLMARFVGAFEIACAIDKPAEEGLRGEPVTEEAAQKLVVGQAITLFTGGAAGDSNDEREIKGVVKSVARRPDQSIGQDSTLEVVIYDRELETKQASMANCSSQGGTIPLYTWRGFLRYGSGAQIVRI